MSFYVIWSYRPFSRERIMLVEPGPEIRIPQQPGKTHASSTKEQTRDSMVYVLKIVNIERNTAASTCWNESIYNKNYSGSGV